MAHRLAFPPDRPLKNARTAPALLTTNPSQTASHDSRRWWVSGLINDIRAVRVAVTRVGSFSAYPVNSGSRVWCAKLALADLNGQVQAWEPEW